MDNFKTCVIRDLKPYIYYIPKINKPILRSIVKLCVAFMEQNKYSRDVYDKEMLKITSAHEIQPEDYAIMFTSISLLMDIFLRSRTANCQELMETLKELKFSNECIDDLTKVLMENHQNLFDNFQETRILKPIEKLQYRINISLCETGQNPTIILHLEYKGRSQTINLSLKHFHRFRLAVATILSEFHGMESKNKKS